MMPVAGMLAYQNGLGSLLQQQSGLQSGLAQSPLMRVDMLYGCANLAQSQARTNDLVQQCNDLLSGRFAKERLTAWVSDGYAVLARMAFWRGLLGRFAWIVNNHLAKRLDRITENAEGWLAKA